MHDTRENKDGSHSWWQQFGSPLRWLVLGFLVAGIVSLAGIGAISVGRTQTDLASTLLRLAGEGLLMAGAMLALAVTIRVWWLMFKGAGWTATRGTDGSNGDV